MGFLLKISEGCAKVNLSWLTLGKTCYKELLVVYEKSTLIFYEKTVMMTEGGENLLGIIIYGDQYWKNLSRSFLFLSFFLSFPLVSH